MSIACVMAQAALPIPLLGPMSFSAKKYAPCGKTEGWEGRGDVEMPA